MARIRDEDGLFELTEEDLKKVVKGDDSPFYQMHDTLPDKPLGFKFDECPEECMSNGILPILVSKKCPALYSMIEGMAAVAIQKFFGPDGVHRPIKSIFKVNAGGAEKLTYYITFSIENNEGEELFQAEVYKASNGNFIVPHLGVEGRSAVKDGLLEGSITN
ncbi:hypothetical protein P3L10_011849 [Capsicum annuum]